MWLAALAVQPTATLAAPSARPTSDAPPLVYAAEVDSIIHPVSAEFMVSVIDRADQDHASLVIFTLRTPGGLVDSTQTIVARMLAARTPIAVFVAPGGARAASAGFLIVMAADVAAMAPGTHMGAAHPVSLGGGDASSKPDETMSKKAASDLAAWARSLAERRKRNVALAAEAITDSRAFTDSEALGARPPLIDVVATDVHDLIAKLDGRTFPRFDGRMVTMSSAKARIVELAMTRRQRLLSAIAHPQIAYLLLMLGTLGITIELWTPGAIAPGVVGGLCLLLAFFAFQVLPVSTAGVLLVLFGLALLILEIKVPSFGVLGLGGILSLVVGLLMLPGDVPGVGLDPRQVIPVALAMSAILIFLGRLALRAHRQPAATGAVAMIGLQGRALEGMAPGRQAQVAVHGEIWRAIATAPVAQGELVSVVGVDGLTLRVAPASSGGGVSAPARDPEGPPPHSGPEGPRPHIVEGASS
jgi:membrane-bound serine protease (ClpP class)